MTTEVVEHVFTGATGTNYDSTRTTLGSLMVQNTGTTAKDVWAGPLPIVHAQTYDTVLASYIGRTYIIDGDNNCDWIFIGFNPTTGTTALAAPIMCLYTYNRTTRKFTFVGYCSFTMPYSGTQGVYPLVNFSVSRHLYTTGTVAVNGTGVTGMGSEWQSARIATGARIGFGSSDSNQITTWYEIGTISSDTSITLLGTMGVGIIPGGTPYVIDELRVCLCCSNPTTVTNAGLFLVKGMNIDVFSGFTKVIPASVSTDNVRAVYWLVETAGATTMQAGFAVPQLSPESNTNHKCFFLNANTTSNIKIYAFNIRASLTVALGRSTSAYLFATGVSGTLPAAIAVYGNTHKFITCNHGPAAGQPSLYVVSASRIYRIPLNQICDGSTSFFAEGFLETPPGGAGTLIATASFFSIDYIPEIDRFIIGTSAIAMRGYITKYLTNGDPLENCWGVTFSQLDRAGTLPDFTPTPTIYGSIVRYSNGIMFLIRQPASSTPGVMYAIPFVHWDYAATNGQRIITPAIDVSRVRSFVRAYTNATTYLGSDSYGSPTDPYRLYARISGIEDNSGTWTLIEDDGDLSIFNPLDRRYTNFAPTKIQFMFEFKTPYWTNIPARIHSVACVYEKFSTDLHFRPSAVHTNLLQSTFAWKFIEAFGSDVPELRVILFEESTDVIVTDDNTQNPQGVFEKSVDNGKTWSTWNNSDKQNDQTYIRYIAGALAANKKVRMVLTLR